MWNAAGNRAITLLYETVLAGVAFNSQKVQNLMKTLIAFAAGMILASGTVYFLLSNRTGQPAVMTLARVQAQHAEQEKPEPAPIVVEPDLPPVVRKKPAIENRRLAATVPAHEPVQSSAYVPRPEQPVYTPRPEPAATPEPPPPAPREPEWKPMTAERSVTHQRPALERTVKRRPNTVTLAANTTVVVRLAETVSSEKQQDGDIFSATLDQPLVVDGLVVAERGSRVDGRVVSADRAGRVRGTSHVELELVNLSTADGQNLKIRTNTYRIEGETSKKEDAEKVGIGAALGAAIGAIAGGGKGAAIGAGAGGAAGAGTVAATRGKASVLPVETRVSFRLSLPITVTERLR